MNLLKFQSFVLLLVILNVAVICASTNRTIVNFTGNFNKLYANAIGREVEYIYSFELPDKFDPLLTRIRVLLRTDNKTTIKFPLLVTIMQTHEATPIRLPLIIRSSNTDFVTYLDASRTLCIHADHFDMDEKHIEIRIATSSGKTEYFELEVLKEDAMKVGLDVPVTIKISPTTPEFFYFQFPDAKDSQVMHVKVTVTSPYEKCSILSIQPALCPVPDHAENVRVAGTQNEASTGWEWETLTTKGAIVTSNKLISTPGFFIALLVMKDDRQCGHLIESQQNINSTTTLTVIVELDQLVAIENVFWTLPVYFPIALNFGILFVCGCICLIIQRFFTQDKNWNKFEAIETFDDVTLSDFNENFRGKKISIRSTYFGKMIIVIAMFFAIPVFELTSYNLTILHTTGDNDICYYNSLCAHPFGYLKDFNHLWSNMGYVIFGIGFICITCLKKKCASRNTTSNSTYNTITKLNTVDSTVEIKNGIPFKSGLYYAMGLALVMEGVMSAAYHICPNRSNFQYDTCFMFMIAAMCILKIFDFRHPRCLGPNGIFTILALFSLVSATGIMLERYQFDYHLRIFKICIMIIHVYFIGFFSVYTLYVGYPITFNKHSGNVILSSRKDIPHFLIIFPNLCKWKLFKFRLHRLISVIIFCTVNLFQTLNIWASDSDFATLLLHFLISNLIYYLLHYVLIKLFVHREFKLNFRSMQPLVYLVLTIGVSCVALLYFKIDLTEWRKTAAYSREGNGKCMLWNFYDEHDIWHEYSAVAIFFLYMTLLTMDDGVQNISQSNLKLI